MELEFTLAMLSYLIGTVCWKDLFMREFFQVVLDTQPPNSPDLNINDLGLFVALQAVYERSSPKDGVELVAKVKEAHQKYPAERIIG